jgi:hypothetical protein
MARPRLVLHQLMINTSMLDKVQQARTVRHRPLFLLAGFWINAFVLESESVRLAINKTYRPRGKTTGGTEFWA